MRPLELRLRNFRSYYGDQHKFDFRDRRLIGIVGPIGSGKSSILDAIAFALYGCTPKIGRAIKSLIHQRADHAAVALRFEVEGEVWEAARNLRRKSAGQHALYRLPDDTEDAKPAEKVTLKHLVDQRIEDLLGLDFHGFCRSVLLAQGQFAQFLGAPPAARDKVLKGVFGYERVGEIRELAKDAVKRVEQDIKVLDVRIEHAEAAKERLDQRKDELAEVRRRLEQLKAARPLFEELTRRIREAEEGRAQAEGRLATLRERSRELPDPEAGKQVVSAAEAARIRREAAERELRDAGRRLEKAEAALESEDYRQAQQDLEQVSQRLAEMESARSRRERRLAELREGESGLPDRVRGIKTVARAEYAWAGRVEARREWEAAAARFDEAEAKVSSEEFTAREQRAAQAEGLIIRLEARKEAAGRAAREALGMSATVEEDEKTERLARSALTSATGKRREAERSVGDAAAMLQDAEGELLDSRHADMAGTLRSRLADGDTCPVCEQPVHQVPPASESDTSTAEEAVGTARNEREDAEERLRAAIGGEQAAAAERRAAGARLVNSRERLDAACQDRNRQEALLAGCHAELGSLLGEGDPEVRLDRERAAIDALRVAVRSARKHQDKKRTELDAAMEEERSVGKALSELRTRIGTLGAKLDPEFTGPSDEIDEVRTALAALHTEWRRAIGGLEEKLRVERQEIELVSARRAEAQGHVNTFRAALGQAREGRDNALGVRDRAMALERKAGRALSDLRATVGRLGAFLDHGFRLPSEEPTAVRASLALLHTGWKDAMTDLRAAVEKHRARREQASGRLEAMRADNRIKGSIEAALAEVGALGRQIETDIGLDEKVVAESVELVHERRKQRKKAQLNQRLVNDLTDARFVRFLLDEERAALADLGSEHFERLSSGRYRFTGDGAFEIVDLNSADAVRRADSLSGGETFLASLALALGLAEMVGRRGGRLDAFFLDEGFGTLDPEHLDLAMEGIESLAALREQRLVVIVSHVPELRERIEDLMVLKKDPVTGDSELMSEAAR